VRVKLLSPATSTFPPLEHEAVAAYEMR